ncbi:hypothetical protein CVT24_012548 [Panaeolus cyanescens]|uniref:Uncharacterized protein n=1 Tax=Panaeolus cyanescens TaxID=181874 RepID=A0A409W607_9AGAR|nr:hypothetical protein CVT24_012548 [Panaeolus cyanescens]
MSADAGASSWDDVLKLLRYWRHDALQVLRDRILINPQVSKDPVIKLKVPHLMDVLQNYPKASHPRDDFRAEISKWDNDMGVILATITSVIDDRDMLAVKVLAISLGPIITVFDKVPKTGDDVPADPWDINDDVPSIEITVATQANPPRSRTAYNVSAPSDYPSINNPVVQDIFSNASWLISKDSGGTGNGGGDDDQPGGGPLKPTHIQPKQPTDERFIALYLAWQDDVESSLLYLADFLRGRQIGAGGEERAILDEWIQRIEDLAHRVSLYQDEGFIPIWFLITSLQVLDLMRSVALSGWTADGNGNVCEAMTILARLIDVFCDDIRPVLG